MSSTKIPLLSLCIPTYNRVTFLAEALDGILKQISDVPDGLVEIAISDNASTDGTVALVEKTIAAHPGVTIRFERNAKNVGPDGNIYKAIRMGRGEFIYILSDDDVLMPGGLKRMIGIITEFPNIDAVTLNIQSFLHTRDNVKETWFDVKEDTEIRDRDTALDLLCPLFLSVVAFRRSLIAGKDYTPRIGTFLIQSYCFLDVLAKSRGVFVTRDVYLAQRMDNTSGWPYFDVMTTNFEEWLSYARDVGFGEDTIQTIKARHLRKSLFTATLSFKLSGSKTKLKPKYMDGMQRLVKTYGLQPFVTMVMIPLIMTPGPLIRAARDIYKFLRRSPA